MIKFVQKYQISYNFLKWSALFWMTYDHVLKKIFDIAPDNLLLFPGRFAFPIFSYIIAWNLARYNIFEKYIKRLIPFAVLTVPIDLYFYPELDVLNIMFTFIVSISIVWSLEQSNKIASSNLRLMYIFYIIAFASFAGLFVDYGVIGVWVIPTIYLLIKKQELIYLIACLVIFALLMPSILYALLITPLVLLLLLSEPAINPNRKKSKKTAWLYYAYFPIHKLIIVFIKSFLHY